MEFTSEVAVAVRKSPAKALKTALSKFSTPIIPAKDTERVIIKPSIYDPSLPGNTDVRLVKEVARIFESVGDIQIVESGNPLRTASEAFSRCGYDLIASGRIELVDLSDAALTSVTFPGYYFKNRKMPALLNQNGFLINVATIKTESDVIAIGAGIKNLFGLLPEIDKSVYHPVIDDVLMDLLSAYKPQLTIIDLTQLVIGDRKAGNVRQVGGVVVGTDPVAVDAFCASLIGFDPLRINHLHAAYDLGLGEILPDLIRVTGTAHQIDELERLCKVL
ncbi:MAG: DUF362 domain-containing protein [Promethearchaeota archaeon]